MGPTWTKQVQVLAPSLDTIFALRLGIFCETFRVYRKLRDRVTFVKAINRDHFVSAVYLNTY